MTEFGHVLRDARVKAGVRQAELARRLGCGQSYISHLEHGLYEPRLSTISRYLSALGYELDLRVVMPPDA